MAIIKTSKVREKVFHITTGERTYNYVNSKEHFQQTVRKNWKDTTPVITAFVWDNGWIAQQSPLGW